MSFLSKVAAGPAWAYYIFCFFLGLAGVLGHAPYFIWPVTLLMFALLFHMFLLAETPKRAFWTGWITGLGYFAGQIYWIGSAFIARGEEFIWLMPFMVGGLALLLAVFWGFAGRIFKNHCSDTRFPYLVSAGLIFLAEMVRGHLFGGFPWNLPAYIFKAGDPLSQSASLWGVYGLSFIVLVVSALMARILFQKSYLSGVFAALLIIGNLGFGLFRLSAADLAFVDDVKIRIVSSPFSQKDKMDINQPEKSREIVQDHINLTAASGLETITHVIWPEGVLDMDIHRVPQVRAVMGQTLSAGNNNPPVWILNSARIQESGDGVDYYNSSSAWSFSNQIDGELIAMADKRKLVPFGEIIPGGKWVEKIGMRVISEDIGSFTPASSKNIVDITGLPKGTIQICYEIVFSGFTTRRSDERPQWILNQSNDAWFGTGAGPEHHANIARYRAIEEKIPLMRSASNGYSGIIDPWGRYVAYAPPDSRQVIDSRLPQAIGESLPFGLINPIWALLTFILILIARRLRVVSLGGGAIF